MSIDDLDVDETELREALVKFYGDVWNTREATNLYEFVQFLAPYVEVRRKSDGQRGVLTFVHRPRFYYDFRPIDG